jgi:glycosyltransferase involved in cell wall biosynthesis
MTNSAAAAPSIAVVIPCYRVHDTILSVLARLGPEVTAVFVVDDACPQGSGESVRRSCRDARVHVLTHETNQGVGGAVITGYRAALAAGATIVVKIDGDGQMDPADLPALISPIAAGEADYTKGNRFFRLEDLSEMPAMRIAGNAALSFLSKLSSGYWGVFDPTNGFTAIDARVLALLPLEKVRRDFFFESDMLFRLNTIGAVTLDIPMPARYPDARSNLRIAAVIPTFLARHGVNFAKRIVYNYYLRDFSVASLELLLGLVLFGWGTVFGAWRWAASMASGEFASGGTIMLAALPVLVGIQLLLAFLAFDISRTPRVPLHTHLPPSIAATRPAPPG